MNTKDIIAKVDVFTLIKLETRASSVGLSVEDYVSLFLDKRVEPITL